MVEYTQCTVKLRPNFQKIAKLKCTTNEKRNLSEHDEQNFGSWQRELSKSAFDRPYSIICYPPFSRKTPISTLKTVQMKNQELLT